MTEAWVTMVTSDSYVVGAVVLAHSLQSTCTVSHKRPIVCMVTPGVSSYAFMTLIGSARTGA